MMPDGLHPSEDIVARRALLVFVGTALAWLLVQWLGRVFGWSPPLLLVFDVAALAGFVWGAAMAVRIWRKRRKE